MIAVPVPPALRPRPAAGGAAAALLGALLLAAPARPAEPAAGAPGASGTPEFTAYRDLLAEFVTVVSAPGEPIDTRVDYTRLHRSPDLRQRFALIRRQLFEVSPSRLEPAARLAWAINAYNFLVLETATLNLYESTKSMQSGGQRYAVGLRIATVNTIRLDGGAFFDGPVVTLEGEPYSLERLERAFVFGGFDPGAGKAPPRGFDPRPHFALSRASIGSPPLLPRPFTADSLERQLDYAVRNALAQPRHLRLHESGRLEANAVLDWHRADFGGMAGAFAFVRKHAPEALRAEIEKRKLQWIGAYILWDWGINHTDAKKAEEKQTG